MTFSDFREKCYGSKLAQIGPNYHFSFFKIIPESNLLHHTASPSMHHQLIIMPTCSVMLHNLHELQRDRMHQRCIKVASLKVRSEAYTMHQGCINDASTLHSRCIHVAFTLHPRCINDASLYVYASCNQAATKLQHWVDGACIEAAPSMRDIFG